MSMDQRSEATAVAVLTRMSVTQKRQLAQDAADAGMTMRRYVLWKVFGTTDVRDTPGRIPRRQEELPMAG